MVFIKKCLAQKHVGVWKHSILTKMGNKKSSNLSIFGSKIFSSVNILLTEKGIFCLTIAISINLKMYTKIIKLS